MIFKAIKLNENHYVIVFGDDDLITCLSDSRFCKLLNISLENYYHEMMKLPGVEGTFYYETVSHGTFRRSMDVVKFTNLKDANNAVEYLNDKYAIVLNLILLNK